MGLLKPRTTTVLIYQGDDLDRLAELHRAAEHADAAAKAAAGSPLRVGDEAPMAQAERDAYNAAVDEAAERAIAVVLTTIGPTRWRNLLAEHPARTHEVDGKPETIEDDQLYEVNTETFPMALLTYSRDGKRTATIDADPPVSDADFREFLEEEVAPGDFERLWQSAYWLNRALGADPKDSKFSAAFPRSPES